MRPLPLPEAVAAEPCPVVLLVVPEDVPLVVVLGTCDGDAGTVLPRPGVVFPRLGVVFPRLGVVLPRLGTWPGSAGTAGTAGPAVVVPGVEESGGVTTTCGFVVVPVVPVPPVVLWLELVAPGRCAGGGPSGNTQVTSRFEQKSGIVVRSLDASAANASGTAEIADSAAAAASVHLRVFIEISWARGAFALPLQTSGRSPLKRSHRVEGLRLSTSYDVPQRARPTLNLDGYTGNQ